MPFARSLSKGPIILSLSQDRLRSTGDRFSAS
jgi:hypothetical protein